MSVSRIKRISSLLKQELSKIIQSKLRDDRIGFISIIDIEITKDLRFAKVFYSQIGSDEEKKDTQKALKIAAKFIKGELGRAIQLKTVPNLKFIYDESIERASHLSTIFREIKE